MKIFPLRLKNDQHATLKRRAKAKGLSIHRYCLSLLLDGKVDRKSAAIKAK